MLRVHSLESFGTHEGPGIRFVVFLQGCKLRCLYCHNPDTQSMDGGTLMSIDELLDRVAKTQLYFGKKGGVTVSGGEPTLQAEALADFFIALQQRGIHTALDTNGAPAIDVHVKKLLAHTDLVLLDIKHIDSIKHEKLTGVHNKSVLEFARYCESNGNTMWIRHVLVPGYTDDPQDLDALAHHFVGWKHIERIEILPYHTLGVYKYAALKRPYHLKGVSPPTPQQIAIAKACFQKYLPHVYVR